MGQTILTTRQSQFLEQISCDTEIANNFYLTGGTALAEFHLHHRLSEDIDLFTEKHEVNQLIIEAYLQKISSKLGIVGIDRSQFMGLFSYHLTYPDHSKLKVDFNYYPFPQIEKGPKIGLLSVDSLVDIATNKVHTLFVKPRTRDYIDLYFILQYSDLDLTRLISLAKAKFDWNIDKLNLANQFIRIKDIKHEDYPAVIGNFDIDKMELFFLDLALKLKESIFET